MSKKVTMSARPPKQPNADDWIADQQPVVSKPNVKPVRMTVELDPALHQELKVHCTMNRLWISELVRKLIVDELEVKRILE